MIITDYKPEKGHLYKIFTDAGTYFLLNRDFFDESGLKRGTELTEEKIRQLTEESDYIRAKSRALWFLDRSDRSEKVLFEKIISGGINKSAAAKAVARLKELGLVDDRRFAENMTAHYLSENRSKRQIYLKLTEKGVPSAIANEVLKDTEIDEVSAIKAVIEKKYSNKLSSKEDMQKVVAALMRRGYNYGNIRTALKEYQFELEECF